MNWKKKWTDQNFNMKIPSYVQPRDYNIWLHLSAFSIARM